MKIKSRLPIVVLLPALALLWLASVALTIVGPVFQLRWEEAGTELNPVEVWMINTSLWLRGSLHEHQTLPGLVFLSMFCAFIGAGLIAIHIANRKK